QGARDLRGGCPGHLRDPVRHLSVPLVRQGDPRLRGQPARRPGGRAQRQASLCAHLRPRDGLRGHRRLPDVDADRRHPGAGARVHAARLRDRHHRRTRLDDRRARRRRADRRVGVGRRPAVHALGQGHGVLRTDDPRPRLPAAGPVQGALMNRSVVCLLALLAVLLVLPLALDRYLLAVMILIFYFAFVGQAWNVMMGFCGQLSIGHALYVGLGAYTAAALYQHFGVIPWVGMLVAVAVCVIAASIIGWLAFRFGIGGTYFALLTIAFAEFTRIGFEHFDWVGGTGGFFLKVVQQDRFDLLNLRGHPVMFYYLALALAVGGFLVSAWLLRGRLGYYFRAIRDNEEAARAA